MRPSNRFTETSVSRPEKAKTSKLITVIAGLTYCLALGAWMQWPWWLNLILGIMYGEAVRRNAYNVSHPLSGVYLFSLPFYVLHWPIWIGIICGALVGVSAGYRATKHHILQQKLELYKSAREQRQG